MKLYPCQKIALANMDESSDKTRDGIWTCRVECKATDRVISRQYVPKYNTLSGVIEMEKEMEKEMKDELINRLCRYCDWREDDGETEEICPV